MIIFIGVSGSGKSVQSKKLAEQMGYTWISSGEFLRSLLKGQARQDMVDGKLLPDQDVINMLDGVLNQADLSVQCVLDGFPRTAVQVDWLLSQVHQGRFKIDTVFHLSLDHGLARDRLTKRDRLDDHEAAINQRLSEYNEVTVPVINELKNNGINICEIDASQPIEQVHQQIVKMVKES